MTNRIDHTGHGHDATTSARTACRKLTGGARVGDRIQDSRGEWGQVLSINYRTGELQTRFSDVLTLWVPGSEIRILERS